MNVLVVDVGGSNVKILSSGQEERRRFPSGPTLTPMEMVAAVKQLAGDWKYDVVSVGYPGRVVEDRAIADPRNLGPGWVGFDYAAAFGCPVKVMNDAAMQALGSYSEGTMLFLGLGTGLGSALIVRGHVVPMELGALSYKKGRIDDYLGDRGRRRRGRRKWQASFERLVERFTTAFFLDDIVVGGGNAKKLKRLPTGCRLGANANAFTGGFRMWEPAAAHAAGNARPPVHPGGSRAQAAHT